MARLRFTSTHNDSPRAQRSVIVECSIYEPGGAYIGLPGTDHYAHLNRDDTVALIIALTHTLVGEDYE